MITLNLLPKKLKKEAELERVNISIIGMFILLLIIVGLTVELLFATKKFLLTNITALESQQQAYEQYLESEINTEVGQNIKNINKLSSRLDKIQKDRTPWSQTLAELANITPDEMKITGLDGNKRDKTIKITGFSPTREQLLTYTKTLENSEYINKVDLPSTHLSNPTDINFKLTAELSDKALMMGEK